MGARSQMLCVSSKPKISVSLNRIIFTASSKIPAHRWACRRCLRRKPARGNFPPAPSIITDGGHVNEQRDRRFS
jgi:hypothetical protein